MWVTREGVDFPQPSLYIYPCITTILVTVGIGHWPVRASATSGQQLGACSLVRMATTVGRIHLLVGDVG